MRQVIIASLTIACAAVRAGQPESPHVNESVPVAAVEQMQGNSHVLIMSSPSQFYRHFVLTDGVRWDLGVSDEGQIKYVSTKDTRFKTAEGITVGMRLSDVRARIKEPMIRYPGWAWAIELPSGGKAAFVQGRSLTEGSLSASAPVSFLYCDN
ncbi:MAG: hypothetical protein WAO00_00525 [Chthoniobacterales bacterium]